MATATVKKSAPRLKKIYQDAVIKQMMEQFGYENIMQVPKPTKIVLNMGVGEGTADQKRVLKAAEELTLISGQKAVLTKSKKSIATFKLRQNLAIGCMVTLRSDRMWEFLDKLVTIALPRVRDFRGVSGRSFDGRGNYSLGLKEQFVFPEINYDKVEHVQGMDIVICTTANTDKEAKALLKAFNMPFYN